jgi:hypothetical protein
LLNHESQF